MKTKVDKLNIIDEQGNIIGEDTRENIHNKGLLHREIHVWFYTPNGEIIFQHRGKNKDTYPDLLDASVGGHVEIGDDYENAALKELEEETGIRANKDDIVFIQYIRSKSFDDTTGKINNVIRAIYVYRYVGKIEDLRVESGKAIRFEAWLFDKIFHISEKDKKRFIPILLGPEMLDVFSKIENFNKK